MLGPDPGVGRGGDAVQHGVSGSNRKGRNKKHGATPFTSPEVHVGAPFGTPPVVPRWHARAHLQALTLVWVVSVATLLAFGLVENLTHVNVMGNVMGASARLSARHALTGTARTMGRPAPEFECAGTLNAGHCVCGPRQSCHGRHCIDAHHAIGGNGALNRPTAVMHGYDPVKCPWCRCIWHVSL